MKNSKASPQFVPLSLLEWIEQEGTDTIAKALGVTRSTINHWKRGYVLPRSEIMIKIRKLSRGAVSIEQMVEAHFAATNKNNRYTK